MLRSLKAKKFIQFMSLILFPITINYLSPYLIIVGATQGIVNGSFIIFISLLVGSVFFGRLFCSTLCPAGAAGDCLSQVNEKNVKNGRYNLIKWMIWVPWLMGIISGIIAVGGIKEINMLFMTDGGISVNRPEAYIIYLSVFFLIIIVNVLVGKRAMCHYVCWMAPFMIIGIKLRRLLHLPGLTLKAEKDTCISCKKCSKACPMSLNVTEMVLSKQMTNTECILCGTCISVCPKHTIDYSMK